VSEDLPDIVPGLAALAGADGKVALEAQKAFDVTIDDVTIHVEYSAGTTPTVFLSTPYLSRPTAAHVGRDRGYRESPTAAIAAARPLAIELCLESDLDRDAKARGVTRELQTGDAEFDRMIYVDSPAPDEVLASVFAGRALREACRTLLDDGFLEIWIDDERGEITTRRGLSTRARLPADQVIRAFAAIARDVPPLETTGRRSRRAKDLLDGAAAMSVLGVVSLLLVLWGSALEAFVVGGLLGGLLAFWVTGRLFADKRRDVVLAPVASIAFLLGGGVGIWIGGPARLIGWAIRPTIGLAIGAVVGWCVGCGVLASGLRGRSDSHRTRFAAMTVCVSVATLIGALVGYVS